MCTSGQKEKEKQTDIEEQEQYQDMQSHNHKSGPNDTEKGRDTGTVSRYAVTQP